MLAEYSPYLSHKLAISRLVSKVSAPPVKPALWTKIVPFNPETLSRSCPSRPRQARGAPQRLAKRDAFDKGKD